MTILTTQRLLIREWKESDVLPFAAMNADRQVMEYFPGILSWSETKDLLARIATHIKQHQFGLWAVELKNSGEFIGFIGLNIPQFSTHFTPCIEIGWRLAQSYWGKGLATEGAEAVLAYGFNQLKLAEIVSFTAKTNLRSRRVMEKLGFSYTESDDFNHPKLALSSSLSQHVLYRLSATQFANFALKVY